MIPGTFRVLVPSWHQKNGLTAWECRNGATVVQLHYSADPEKTKDWAERAAKSFPGGIEGAQWQQEMEIEAEAKFGARVYPDVTDATHVIDDIEIPPDDLKWRVIDPGYHDPLCCLWIAWTKDPKTGDKRYVVYREHYQAGWLLEKHIPRILELSGSEEYQSTLIDPVAFRDTLEGGEASIAERLARAGIHCGPAHRPAKKYHAIGPVGNLLRMRDNGQPLMKFTRSCVMTFRDVTQLRYDKATESNHQKHNAGEKPMDVNDHATDCLGYFACTVVGERAEKVRASRRAAMRDYDRPDWSAEAEYAGVTEIS